MFPVEEKTYVADIDRTVYDIKDDEKDAYKLQAGLTPEIVQKISDEKNDPAWMQLNTLSTEIMISPSSSSSVSRSK